MDIDSSPHRRWPFTRWVLLLMAAAFVGGLLVGFLVVAFGAHGGSFWPTILLSAPAFPVATLLFDDSPEYAYALIIGTGVTYALYALLIGATRKLWIVLCVIGLHLTSAAMLATWCGTR